MFQQLFVNFILFYNYIEMSTQAKWIKAETQILFFVTIISSAFFKKKKNRLYFWCSV